MDELFQWIQARYALSNIREAIKGDTAIEQAIDDLLLNTLEKPNTHHFTTSWVDDFLPSWSRLCWRESFIPVNDVQRHQLPIDADVHIPWNALIFDRPDLKAAARMFMALERSTRTWQFEKHPGMILDSTGKLLIIPVPVWEPDNMQNSFIGLQALMKSFHNGNRRGPIRQISLLPLMDEGAAPDQQRVDMWKTLVARYSKINRFADAGNIGTFNLSDL